MRAAYVLAERALPTYSSKFSRHDFTLPQLFACLAVREHQKKSYRGTEALLRDCPEWLADIGLEKVPDHNTLCRAFGEIVKLRRVNKMLDVTAEWFTEARVLRLTRKPLAADSTHFESHHVSRHYERRRKQTAGKTVKTDPDATATNAAKTADKAGSFTRSGTSKKLPKATFAVAVSTGAGSDAPSFDRLLFDAWRRAPVKAVVADPGFDSEKNHRIARLDMGVRSIIPPLIGRPSKGGAPPSGRFRRLMHHRFKRKADKKTTDSGGRARR